MVVGVGGVVVDVSAFGVVFVVVADNFVVAVVAVKV